MRISEERRRGLIAASDRSGAQSGSSHCKRTPSRHRSRWYLPEAVSMVLSGYGGRLPVLDPAIPSPARTRPPGDSRAQTGTEKTVLEPRRIWSAVRQLKFAASRSRYSHSNGWVNVASSGPITKPPPPCVLNNTPDTLLPLSSNWVSMNALSRRGPY